MVAAVAASCRSRSTLVHCRLHHVHTTTTLHGTLTPLRWAWPSDDTATTEQSPLQQMFPVLAASSTRGGHGHGAPDEVLPDEAAARQRPRPRPRRDGSS